MADIFTAVEVSALEKEIRADAAAAPEDIKKLFCDNWPFAKKAIDALLKILKNPVAKLILSTVEKIGDIAFSIFCTKK